MRLDQAADLGLLIADPERLAAVRAHEIPALLGALETIRTALWAKMLRAPEPPAVAGGTSDELLTVPEVAAELKFTPSYVYEAVRRRELEAVRKGKYVRIRRADVQAWLEGRRSKGLDPQTAARDSSSHARRPTTGTQPPSVRAVHQGRAPRRAGIDADRVS